MANEPDYNKVFFEHPSGEFNNSQDATISAISKLYKYEKVNQWLTLSAQGIGYHDFPVKVKRPLISVEGKELNINQLISKAGVDLKGREAKKVANGTYNLEQFNAEEIGKIIYSIYTNYYKVKAFPGDSFFGIIGEWL